MTMVDDKIIDTMSPQQFVALMNETGMFSITGTGSVDGNPIVQAALKLKNAQTGEVISGGLPFAVIMFKAEGDPGYTNIAIATRVPAAELHIEVRPGFFAECNRQYRFVRSFPVDRATFVLQMDLFLRMATREYVKFNLSLWAAVFSSILFELLAQRGGEASTAAVHSEIDGQPTVLPEQPPVLSEQPMMLPEPVVAELPAVGEVDLGAADPLGIATNIITKPPPVDEGDATYGDQNIDEAERERIVSE
jgi:hypothetical protein